MKKSKRPMKVRRSNMAYTERNMYVSSSKYNKKCPYSMSPSYITVHNTANDASANNEAKYMRNNNSSTSFHDVVDDKEVIHCIPHNRNAWHAGDGNGNGNRKSIGVEICYSKSGGSRFNAAEQNAAIYIAKLLKSYGWGISRVKRHKDWSGKNCPHRTMANGWQRFLNMITAAMGGSSSGSSPSSSGSTKNPSPSGIDVKYRAYANGKWWANIVNYNTSNSNGYAGVIGKSLLALEANTVGDASKVGKLQYRLHKLGGSWFGWHTDREKDSAGDTYAGNRKSACDMLQMTLTGVSGYKVRYRVYAGGKWWGWITNYSNSNTNGYAGVKGKAIQAVQIQIVKG